MSRSQERGETSIETNLFGKIKITSIMWVYLPIMILTPCYTYYMATIKHQEVPPFPHSTVTTTARHYPQDIVFRYTMGIASSIMVLLFYVIFRWINQEAERVRFRKMKKYMFYLVMCAMVCYCIAVQTIDGKGTGSLHGPSAGAFFVIWQIAIVYITSYLHELSEWNTSVISKKSLRLKSILAAYVTVVWIVCIYFIVSKEQSDQHQVIIQWNAVFINLLWILSFVYQWRSINICLVQWNQSTYLQDSQVQSTYLQDNQIQYK